ncbi:type IV pilus assembly protein PilM, partial [Candidatus Sumerlaeota bacterium]|nr:type IV pilus assembly protein PilM [Candidatus Sumerlaeota bacterium]
MVKVIQLRKAGKGIEVEKCAVEPIYAGRDKKSSGMDMKGMKTSAIKKALERAGISSKYAVSSVSGESIIVRYIQLPDMPENELKNALRWEAEEYIPFRIDDVNIDSVILGKAQGENVGKVDVLLVSAKKDLINEHLEIIKNAGLIPVIVDVDSFAFLNCFEMNHSPDPNEVIALINIGAEITNINVYINGTSRFSRDISIAGDTITNAIAGKLNLDFTRAETLKINEGAPYVEAEISEEETGGLVSAIRGTVEKITGEEMGDDSEEMIAQKIIRNTLQNLIGEISRSIQFFENQSTGKSVQKVVLGGGTSRMKNIVPFFSRELGLPSEVIDPLRRISVKDAIAGDVTAFKEMLSVGIGLALRKVVE